MFPFNKDLPCNNVFLTFKIPTSVELLMLAEKYANCKIDIGLPFKYKVLPLALITVLFNVIV